MSCLEPNVSIITTNIFCYHRGIDNENLTNTIRKGKDKNVYK